MKVSEIVVGQSYLVKAHPRRPGYPVRVVEVLEGGSVRIVLPGAEGTLFTARVKHLRPVEGR